MKKGLWIAAACVIVAIVGAVLTQGSGGSSDDGLGDDPGSGNPDSTLTLEQARQPLKDAPPELASIRSQANELLEDGDLQTRLDELKQAGIPVVINKWASWCAPCRAEFPDFQSEAEKYGDKVAFIGINSNDGPDTGRTFLSEFPVPYPSYSDPDQDIAKSVEADFGFPNTVFIDASGDTDYIQRGQFASADQLNQHIEALLD